MQDVGRVQYVTQYYNQLQGLKYVPLGVYFILLGLDEPGRFPWLEGSFIGRTWTVWGLVVVGVLYWLIKRYYDERYGRVNRSAADQQREEREGLVLMGLFLVAFLADVFLGLPVSLSAFVFGGNYLYLALVRAQRFRRHYVVFGLLFAALGLLPLFLDIRPYDIVLGGNLFTLAGGVLITGIGLLDHLLLVRTFQPVVEG